MRLLIVGPPGAEIVAAATLAAASGAKVRHLANMAAALEQLRDGHGADLLLLDAADGIRAAIDLIASYLPKPHADGRDAPTHIRTTSPHPAKIGNMGGLGVIERPQRTSLSRAPPNAP